MKPIIKTLAIILLAHMYTMTLPLTLSGSMTYQDYRNRVQTQPTSTMTTQEYSATKQARGRSAGSLDFPPINTLSQEELNAFKNAFEEGLKQYLEQTQNDPVKNWARLYIDTIFSGNQPEKTKDADLALLDILNQYITQNSEIALTNELKDFPDKLAQKLQQTNKDVFTKFITFLQDLSTELKQENIGALFFDGSVYSGYKKDVVGQQKPAILGISG